MNKPQQYSDDPHASSSGKKIKNPTSKAPISSSSSPAASEIETDAASSKKWRPLEIFTWGVTHSPRLIGWNDEDFRKLVEEHRKRRIKDPSIPNIEETGFGLMGILANALKEAVYKKTDFDDLKSDLKKIEDSNNVGATLGSLSLSSQDQASTERVKSKGTTKDSSSIDIVGSSVNLKDMKVYNNVLSAIKYQRDAYIMGTEYAEIRKSEREEMMEVLQPLAEHGPSATTDAMEQSTHESSLQSKEQTKRMPLHDHSSQISTAATSNTTIAGISNQKYIDRQYPDAFVRASTTSLSSSLASNQLTGLLTWFIPSQTMHTALLPTVLWTIAPPSPQLPEGGPLRTTINRSVCDLIPLSQSLLDSTMKNSILWVLSDESWRESVKGSSRNYLSYTDTGTNGVVNRGANIHPSASGGRVVVTKNIRMNR